MPSSQEPRWWVQPLSRRDALRAGGAGIAGSSLSLLGLNQASALAETDSDEHIQPTIGRDIFQPQASSGSISQAISGLDAIVADSMERTDAPGLAVAVVHGDQVAYLKGFGVRDSRTREPVDADTVFQIASLSKPIASTVIAGLVGDGVVEWDSRIADLLPEFEMHDPWVTREVTIRDMFAHRSGLPDHAGDPLEDIGYSRDEIRHRLRYQKPDYSFRAGYAYTNFGLTAAAVAAATAAGLSWENVSEQRLYDRIGMTRTSSRFDDFVSYADRARTHVRIDGQWRPEYVRDPDAQSPAGGVSSTARDMALWMRLHLGNGTLDGEEIISGAALAETHRPQVISTPPANPITDLPSFYGLGWNVGYDGNGNVRLSHSGAFALGASTTVFLIPSLDLGICVLSNAEPIGIPEAVAISFLDLVQTGEIQQDYLAIFGQIFEQELAPWYSPVTGDPPADAAPSLGASAYLGVYDNDLYGPIEIAGEGNALTLFLGPDRTEFPLRHFDRDVFTYQPAGENAAGPSAVTFAVGPDRQATHVVIDNLNADGQGDFHKTQPGD